MNAEILCIGTELLLGDVVNSNAAYIARGLAECGVGCYYQSVVGDNPERLMGSLKLAL
ncbi:MAG: molybdopterin-binding protein, partial [Oscillospiraceae bacterium]|nr:molybdopterin-binding protein [Oscillospiraceae bacterium]